MIKTWEPQAKSCLCKLPKVSVFQVIRQCGTITFTSGHCEDAVGYPLQQYLAHSEEEFSERTVLVLGTESCAKWESLVGRKLKI